MVDASRQEMRANTRLRPERCLKEGEDGFFAVEVEAAHDAHGPALHTPGSGANELVLQYT